MFDLSFHFIVFDCEIDPVSILFFINPIDFFDFEQNEFGRMKWDDVERMIDDRRIREIL